MDWINFFFPSIIPFQLQTDERFLDEFYDVFEERMNDSQFLCIPLLARCSIRL